MRYERAGRRTDTLTKISSDDPNVQIAMKINKNISISVGDICPFMRI